MSLVALFANVVVDEWRQRAACKGKTDLFFSPAHEAGEAKRQREAAAKALCATCPAVFECRQYARTHREHGTFGGETEAERAAAGYGPDTATGIVRRAKRQATG